MTAGNSERHTQRDATERILGDGLVIDLSRPPSRADLGLVAGQRSTMLQRRDRQPFAATVRFRDGHELTTTGVVLAVSARSADGPPVSVTVRRDGLSLEDLREVLDEAVRDSGAERSRADSVLAQSRRAQSGRADAILSLPTRVAAPDHLEVQSIVTADEGRVSVNYDIAWEKP